MPSQVSKKSPEVAGLKADMDLGFILQLVALSNDGVEQGEVVALVGQ